MLGDPRPPVTLASVGTCIHVLISTHRHKNKNKSNKARLGMEGNCVYLMVSIYEKHRVDILSHFSLQAFPSGIKDKAHSTVFTSPWRFLPKQSGKEKWKSTKLSEDRNGKSKLSEMDFCMRISWGVKWARPCCRMRSTNISWAWGATCNPNTGKPRQANLCEFLASLVYVASYIGETLKF